MRWDTDDALKLMEYCGLDTCATARVRREIYKEPDWKTPRVKRLFGIHERMSKLGAELHSTGFWVIEPNRQALVTELTALSEVRHKALVSHVGAGRSPGFRGTDNDMRALLYRRHAKDGIQCYDIPEPEDWDNVMWTNDQHNALAVDKEALLRIYINPSTPNEVTEAIALFWLYKAPGKAKNTWVEGQDVLESIASDGRDHADWNSAGTETMRWACRLMTLPEDKDDESLGGRLPNIRSMYGAEKGHVLYHWDWSQQELRMLQAISGDKALGQALALGDVYTFDAHSWFPDQLERLFGSGWRQVNLKKEWKGGRRQCKVGHLAFQYMAGVAAGWTQALMQDRKITFSAMKGIRALFHRTYQETVQYAETEHAAVLGCGYSEGRILGGRRYYPPNPEGTGVDPPITETCNYPVQRTAGEMGALAMLAIRDTLLKYKVKAKILTNEHDAGTTELKDNAVTRRDVQDITLECVQGPWTIRGNHGTVKVQFPAKGKFGYTWAEACAD